MHQEKLVSVLSEVFVRQGFETTVSAQLAGKTGDGYEAPLLAEREDLALLIDFYDENLDSAILAVLEEVVRDTGADLGLLIHTGSRSPDTEVPPRIIVWDVDELARAVGAHLLDGLGLPARTLLFPDPVPAELTEMPLDDEIVPPQAQVDFLDQLVELEPVDVFPTVPAAPVLVETPAIEAFAQTPKVEPELVEFLAETPGLPVPIAAPAPAAPVDLSVDGFAMPGAQPEKQIPAAPDPSTQPSNGFAPLVEAAAAAAAVAPLLLPAATSTAPNVPLPESLEPEIEPSEPPTIHPAFASLVPAALAHPVIPDNDPLSPLSEKGPAEPIMPRLPVKVTLAQAKAHSDPELFGMQRYELGLVPVHLFDFEVDLLIPGSLNTQTERGRIQVHGNDKRTDEVDADEVEPALVGILPSLAGVPWSERVLRVSPERAQQMAQDAIIQGHSKAIDVPLDYETGLTARRRITPTPNNVRLKSLGVYLRPLWRIWGPNGQMDVDGITGEVVELVLKAPEAGFEIMRGNGRNGVTA